MTVCSAVPISPLSKFRAHAPWKAKDGYKGTFGNRLSQEISDFVTYIKPSESEATIRHATIQRLSETIASKWPKAIVTTFGSFTTDLYSSISDLDVNIEFPPNSVPSSVLRQLKQLVETSRITTIGKAQALETATVPLVKYEDAVSHISVDVTCQNSRGPNTSQWLRNEIQQRPNIRAVIMILKHFLFERRLNNVFTGGLSSYPLYLMVVGFARYAGADMGQDDPAQLLMGFLNFWSYWNLRERCLSFHSANPVISKPRNKRGLVSLCIIDPLDPNMEIGYQSRHIVHIQTAFMKFASDFRKSASFQMEADVAVPSCLGDGLAITMEELHVLSFFKQLSAADDSTQGHSSIPSPQDSAERTIGVKKIPEEREPTGEVAIDDDDVVAFSKPKQKTVPASGRSRLEQFKSLRSIARDQITRQAIRDRRVYQNGRRSINNVGLQASAISAPAQKFEHQANSKETATVQIANLVDVTDPAIQPFQRFIERQEFRSSTTMADMIDLWIENVSNGSTTDGEQVTTPTEGSAEPYSDDLFDALTLQNKLGNSDPVSEILQELDGLHFGQAELPQTPAGLIEIVYDSD